MYMCLYDIYLPILPLYLSIHPAQIRFDVPSSILSALLIDDDSSRSSSKPRAKKLVSTDQPTHVDIHPSVLTSAQQILTNSTPSSDEDQPSITTV